MSFAWLTSPASERTSSTRFSKGCNANAKKTRQQAGNEVGGPTPP
jgi:hypothetical protein